MGSINSFMKFANSMDPVHLLEIYISIKSGNTNKGEHKSIRTANLPKHLLLHKCDPCFSFKMFHTQFARPSERSDGRDFNSSREFSFALW